VNLTELEENEESCEIPPEILIPKYQAGLAIKKPTQKTQKIPPEKTHYKFFLVFFNFKFFYENNSNFSL
jgi:hypothetical protein